MYNIIMESVIEKLKIIFPEIKIRLGSIELEEKESCLVAGISQVTECSKQTVELPLNHLSFT